MREKTAEEYARELMQMYNSVRDRGEASVTAAERAEQQAVSTNDFEDGVGGLQVNVTTLRHLYPVAGAIVTVFTGTPENPTVIETDVSDRSGKSGVFTLSAPAKVFSESAEPAERPFATYNVAVAADGYVERINMNVPVFSGVVSVQGVDLTPIAAAGSNTAPQIMDGADSYNL